MNNRETHSSFDKEQFEKAGAQAAMVLGKFMSIATELSREFGADADRSFGDNKDDRKKRAEDKKEVLREAGEQLQKMRQAAGYTLDSFSEALRGEIDRSDVSRADVSIKVAAAESGDAPYPRDWLTMVASLLEAADTSTAGSLQAARAKKFAALFDGDTALADCSDEQFEKLLGFVENSYKEAKALLITK